MKSKELLIRLESSLASLNWPSSSVPVFGQVTISNRVPVSHFGTLRLPAMIIVPGGSSSYGQHDELLEKEISLTIVNGNLQDIYGRSSIVGSNEDGATDSLSKGVEDFTDVVINHLKSVTALSSAKITLRHLGEPQISEIKNNSPYIYQTMKIRARVKTADDGPDESEIMRGPGFLYWNPTDNSGTSGTELGYLEEAPIIDPALELGYRGEELAGNTITDVLFLGANPVAYARFLNWNNDTINRLFLGAVSGTSVNFPGALKTGSNLSGGALPGKLLFVPDDSTQVAWMLRKALPFVSNAARIARGEDTALTCTFLGLKDGAGRQIYAGLLEDLTI